MSSAKKMKMSPEIEESFLDIDKLKAATENYRINVDGGEFNIISSDNTHAFYLYIFENSKKASGAKQQDFILDTEEVSIDKVLSEGGDCLVPIDLDLTTKKGRRGSCMPRKRLRVWQVMWQKKTAESVVAAVVEMARDKTDYDVVITKN